MTGGVDLDDLARLTPDLASLGWDGQLDRWAEEWPGAVRGRLARVSRGFSVVFTGGGALLVASSSTRATETGEPATGDFVVVTEDPDGGSDDGPAIAAIAPRRTALCRRAPGRYPEAQVLAANADAVFVMHGLDREVNLRRLERQLVVSWDSGAIPTVVLTKADLVDDADRTADDVAAIAPGVTVITVSVADGRGLDQIRAAFAPNRSVALLGLSGIGKSTLVNTLSDGEVQRTGEVRAADRRGRHTTVTRDLIPLPSGGFVLDTPGVREIGLWQAYDGLDRAFPEIAEAAATCRFADCGHGEEPGCGVRAAVTAGAIEHRRLSHWRELHAELELQETQLTEFARRAESRDRAVAEESQHRTRASRRSKHRGPRGRRGRRGR
jgi:ribosome biogenesis GTPase